MIKERKISLPVSEYQEAKRAIRRQKKAKRLSVELFNLFNEAGVKKGRKGIENKKINRSRL